MSSFKGFQAGKMHMVLLPAQFFSELLPAIDHLAELKVTLYVFWFLSKQEGNIRYITWQDFINDKLFMEGLGVTSTAAETALQEGLERAVLRGTLLKGQPPGSNIKQAVYVLNSERGRAAIRALELGEWTPEQISRLPANLQQERPNIFRLYEENIGPLTPMVADVLRDAEQKYPADWIEDAMRIAATNNIRRWRYVEAILNSWQERGRHAKDRSNTEASRRRYLEGEFAEFIEH